MHHRDFELTHWWSSLDCGVEIEYAMLWSTDASVNGSDQESDDKQLCGVENDSAT